MQEKGKNDFLKGTISISISVIITKILGVLFKVPLSYVLGDEGMGYFNSAYAIYGFFYILCTSGVPKSLTLVLSEYKSVREGQSDTQAIAKYGLKLFGKIGLIATLFNITCAPMLARVIGNNGALLSLYAVAPSILFVSLSGALRGYLNSDERLGSIAVSQLAEASVKLAAGLAIAFVGVRIGAPIYVISALAISGITLGSIVSFTYMHIVAFYHKKNDKSRQKYRIDRREVRKQLLKNALPIAVSSSLLNLSSTLDLMIIIRQLVSTGSSVAYANAIYGNYTTLAVPMFNLVISVLTPVATSYMPKLSDLSFRKDREGFTSALNQLLCVTLLISVPATLSFYFYSFDLLDVLFSSQSSAIGAELLICLSLGICFLSALTVINTALESQGRVIATVISLMLGCIVKLISSYVLIGMSDIGILGAPISTVLSYAVSLCVSLIALESAGVKTYALIKAAVMMSVGAVAFYLPYRLIYSASLAGNMFTSMAVSLILSMVAYIAIIAILFYLLFKRRQNAQKNSFEIS